MTNNKKVKNPVMEAIARLTRASKQLANINENPPDGSFKDGLSWAENEAAEADFEVTKSLTLLNNLPLHKERIIVEVGYGFDAEIWEALEGHFPKEHLDRVLIQKEMQVNEEDEQILQKANVTFAFEVTKADALTMYTMLQMLAGLDMPLNLNQDFGFKPHPSRSDFW